MVEHAAVRVRQGNAYGVRPGAKRLSAREERLKERLTFLSAHVYIVPKRAGKNVSKHALFKHKQLG